MTRRSLKRRRTAYASVIRRCAFAPCQRTCPKGVRWRKVTARMSSQFAQLTGKTGERICEQCRREAKVRCAIKAALRQLMPSLTAARRYALRPTTVTMAMWMSGAAMRRYAAYLPRHALTALRVLCSGRRRGWCTHGAEARARSDQHFGRSGTRRACTAGCCQSDRRALRRSRATRCGGCYAAAGGAHRRRARR